MTSSASPLAGVSIDRRRAVAVLVVFTVTIFTGSALLFLIQPMFAKMVLPLLGGTPAVWATSMVFFQATLLAGYAYAHWSVARFGVKRQALLQVPLVLLPLIVLPISVPDGWTPPAEGRPELWLLGLLTFSLGLPFFVLSTSAPLLQRWFASTGHPSGKDPYFLYASSNAGSMLALLSYPFLLEPALPLNLQSRVWSLIYGLLAAGTIACAWVVRKARPQEEAPPASDQEAEKNVSPATENATAVAGEAVGALDVDAPPPEQPAPQAADRPLTLGRRLRWVVLAFVPSAFMLAVTNYITTDVAAIPLLWVVPLALYLLTFIMVFSTKPVPLILTAWAQITVVVPLVLVMLADVNALLPRSVMLGLPLLALFVFSLMCHTQLANDRPSPSHLTEFYLSMALGGVLGGIFTALVAPAAFDGLVEYPLLIIVACLLLPPLRERKLSRRAEQAVLVALPAVMILATVLQINGARQWLPSTGRMVAIAVTLSLCAILATRPLRFGIAIGAVMIGASIARTDTSEVLFSDRTFFGIPEVLGDRADRFHRLMHGTTLHGVQATDPQLRTEPLSYYHREGPIGKVMSLPAAEAPRIGVIGLGTGSMACYGRPGQQFTFFEIDPVMERIARDPRLFTFLSECEGEHDVVLGDARLSLLRVPDDAFGVLVVDAFNSDSIPVHLLTREAIQLYFDKLAPGGVLAVHISNRYLDLRPVLANIAGDLGLVSLYGSNRQTLEQLTSGKSASQWVVLARTPADLGDLAADPQWTSLVSQPGARVWTDDFSDVFSVFRWRTN